MANKPEKQITERPYYPQENTDLMGTEKDVYSSQQYTLKGQQRGHNGIGRWGTAAIKSASLSVS